MALETMGDMFTSVLDVTIAYPEERAYFRRCDGRPAEGCFGNGAYLARAGRLAAAARSACAAGAGAEMDRRPVARKDAELSRLLGP